jgi:hypothetical protein
MNLAKISTRVGESANAGSKKRRLAFVKRVPFATASAILEVAEGCRSTENIWAGQCEGIDLH